MYSAFETVKYKCIFLQGEVVEDIVITADASRPPLSVIILCSMLSQQYKLFTTCFAHSSIVGLKDDLKLALGESNGVVRNAADIAVSLIWKSGKGAFLTFKVS